MRFEYIEPFAEATRKVLDSMQCPNARRGEVTLVQESAISGDILIVVPLEGESPGNVVLNMDTRTALHVSGNMGAGDGRTLTPLTIDGVAELANMIAGNATSALNDMGFDLKVLPPVVIARDTMKDVVSYLEVCHIPVTTDCGDVMVHVALKNE